MVDRGDFWIDLYNIQISPCVSNGDKGGGEEKLEEEADKGVSQSAVPIPVLKIFIENWDLLLFVRRNRKRVVNLLYTFQF